jgi:hypothetical protein
MTAFKGIKDLIFVNKKELLALAVFVGIFSVHTLTEPFVEVDKQVEPVRKFMAVLS